MAYRGKYKPSYPKKYKGDPTNIIYRSLWERKFMVYCDNNENVLEWHKDVSGKTRSSLIEIKPMRQCAPPPKPKRQTKKYLNEAYEYAKNQAKWRAAQDYCADRRWEFKVMTEKELGIK
jgi:hypothetical protein